MDEDKDEAEDEVEDEDKMGASREVGIDVRHPQHNGGGDTRIAVVKEGRRVRRRRREGNEGNHIVLGF